MDKIFTILFLGFILYFQTGCAKNKVNSNRNTSVDVVNSAANRTNTKVESTPLPQYADAETALAEGNKFFDANENDKAIEAYNQAVKMNPDLGEAYFKLGISYAIRERVFETDAQIVEETPTPTATPKSKNNKVEEAPKKDSEKAFESAVKAFKKILSKNSKDDVAQFYLGRSLDKLNEDTDALKAFREAVKLNPDNSEYQTELGKILIKLAQYDEAVRALKKALELDENNLLAEEQLEKAQAGKERIDFAKKDIERRNDERDNRNQEQTKTVVNTKKNSNSNSNSTPIPNANVGKQGNTSKK
ncbi:hypothetical protein BH10ACI1_BH10ACI1_00320 [soil metagenome]